MTDRLVEDYLKRLDVAATALPPARRAELVEAIGTHIADARSSGEASDETSMRKVLDRLGDPAEIVAAASDGDGTPGRAAEKNRTGRETTAVMLLTIGSLIPLVGWLAGVVLLWGSGRWRIGEKIAGTLIIPGGPFILLAAVLLPTDLRISPAWLGMTLLIVGFVAPFVLGGILLSRASARNAAGHALPQWATARA